ncbi:hypothetical protein BDV19DRAFT_401410 [Aspergillus venezuelensis]
MARPVSRAVFDDIDALNAPLAAVELEEGAKKSSFINPFLPYLGSYRCGDNLAQELIPEQLGKMREPRQLVLNKSCPLYQAGRKFQAKHGILEESFQNWKELLCGCLDFLVILLLNPSNSDKLGYEQMMQQSPTLAWLEENLKVIRLEIRDVIVIDTFPMVPDKLLDSKMFMDNWFELVADSLELTRTCLRHIQPQILISCQCCSKPGNKRWGRLGDFRATELSSSEAGAPQELVKTDVIQHNKKMKEILEKLLTRVLGPFGQWKERRVAEQIESARREVILVKKGVGDGIKALINQMQLVEEWRRQMKGWAGEMEDIMADECRG